MYDGVHVGEKMAGIVAAVGFLSRCVSDPFPYVRRYITPNKKC